MKYHDDITAIIDSIHLRFKQVFEPNSETQICYHLGPGPQVKGFGDWPDQAFQDFNGKLMRILEGQDPETIAHWKRQLETEK